MTGGRNAVVRMRALALALSLANLCLIRSWFGLLFDADFGYFNRLRITEDTLLALGLNLLGLTALFYGLGAFVRQARSPFVKWAGHLGLCALLLIPLNFLRLNYDFVGPKMQVFVSNPLVILSGAGAGLVILRWPRFAARLVSALVLILAPLALGTLGRISLLLLGVGTLAQHSEEPVLAAPLPDPKPAVRLVWVLFDEMDYRLTFAERPAGLLLPELDRLRQESLFATQAYPPAGNTLLSVPAMTTGRSVAQAEPGGPSKLLLTWADTGEIEEWSRCPTVFSQAWDLGFNVGVVGWYHPYARLFPNVLSFCDWVPFSELARGPTLASSWLNQIRAMSPLRPRSTHLALYEQTFSSSLRLATNTSLGLVFLHLPVPHPPPIYKVSTEKLTSLNFSAIQGYLDNLVLADRTLGRLRVAMEQAGVWEPAWLLLTSDHWWREAVRYDGRTDCRVPFLLKAPGDARPASYDRPFDVRLVHHLIQAVLRRDISREEEVVPWLERSRIPPPEAYYRDEE